MSDLEKNDVITWWKAFPGLAKASVEYLSMVESLAASPVKADIKKWDDATENPGSPWLQLQRIWNAC